jgi:hypothetical protein
MLRAGLASMLIAAAVATGACASTAAAEDVIVFNGTCDGSAAVMLDGDTLLVACDEVNKLFAFDASGGKPTARKKLAPLFTPEPTAEIDIEGVARSGNRLWWIGSHGRDGDAKDAPSRRMLFATNVPATDLDDLDLVGGPIDLVPILLKSEKVAAVLTQKVRERAPKEGGLNIEGLATTPDGGLLVGFRSPLSDAEGMSGTAMVVALRPKNDSFVVERVDQLDLDDRGVRDLVRDGDSHLIVAGAVDKGGDFAVYRWDGKHAPSEVVSLGKFKAEAIVDAGPDWLVLSDDGKTKRKDGTGNGKRECDDIRKDDPKHPSVFFQGRRLPKDTVDG